MQGLSLLWGLICLISLFFLYNYELVEPIPAVNATDAEKAAAADAFKMNKQYYQISGAVFLLTSLMLGYYVRIAIFPTEDEKKAYAAAKEYIKTHTPQ